MCIITNLLFLVNAKQSQTLTGIKYGTLYQKIPIFFFLRFFSTGNRLTESIEVKNIRYHATDTRALSDHS